MYESGFDFIRELVYMGAEIYMSDPVETVLHGTDILKRNTGFKNE